MIIWRRSFGEDQRKYQLKVEVPKEDHKEAVVTFAKKITEFQDKIIDIAISGIMAHLQKKW